MNWSSILMWWLRLCAQETELPTNCFAWSVEANSALNISVALALEYEDVLKREDLVPGYTASEIDALLAYFFEVSNLAPIVLRKQPILRDPDDERILEVAIQCGAVIVTHNTRDFAQAARLGVMVKTPAEILEILRKSE